MPGRLAGSATGVNGRRTARAAPKAGSSRRSRYARTAFAVAAPAQRSGSHAAVAAACCRVASARIQAPVQGRGPPAIWDHRGLGLSRVARLNPVSQPGLRSRRAVSTRYPICRRAEMRGWFGSGCLRSGSIRAAAGSTPRRALVLRRLGVAAAETGARASSMSDALSDPAKSIESSARRTSITWQKRPCGTVPLEEQYWSR